MTAEINNKKYHTITTVLHVKSYWKTIERSKTDTPITHIHQCLKLTLL